MEQFVTFLNDAAGATAHSSFRDRRRHASLLLGGRVARGRRGAAHRGALQGRQGAHRLAVLRVAAVLARVRDDAAGEQSRQPEMRTCIPSWGARFSSWAPASQALELFAAERTEQAS